MSWETICIIVLAGIVCGFINTLAGSGSLISLPVLIFFGGLPANVANGTNRIAIFLQSAVGVQGFHRQKLLDVRKGLLIAIPSIAGAVAGAMLAVDLDEVMMERAIGVVFVAMFFVILLKPEKWITGQSHPVSTKPGLIQIIVMFLIGVYGGFIQAGAGIFYIAGLVLISGFDVVRANAVKLFIVLIYTPFVLVVFIVNGQVDYLLGFVLAAGNMIGAWIAVRFAVGWGPKFVRWVLIVVVVASAVKFLGIMR